MTEKPKKPQGNPNPSPATRFGAGNRANPNGKTSETRRMEITNAEKAMRVREMLLDAVGSQLEGMDQAERVKFVEAAVLKLLKDSEDRGLGAPVQAVDHSSKDGSMTPTTITLRAAADGSDD